ncbi:hypothetical protein D3C80_1840220 [compost metagenome]
MQPLGRGPGARRYIPSLFAWNQETRAVIFSNNVLLGKGQYYIGYGDIVNILQRCHIYMWTEQACGGKILHGNENIIRLQNFAAVQLHQITRGSR